MGANTVKFICSEHGEQPLKSFCFAGIVLLCGCWWRDVYEQGLVFHPAADPAPVQQQLGRVYVQMDMFHTK